MTVCMCVLLFVLACAHDCVLVHAWVCIIVCVRVYVFVYVTNRYMPCVCVHAPMAVCLFVCGPVYA